MADIRPKLFFTSMIRLSSARSSVGHPGAGINIAQTVAGGKEANSFGEGKDEGVGKWLRATGGNHHDPNHARGLDRGHFPMGRRCRERHGTKWRATAADARG